MIAIVSEYACKMPSSVKSPYVDVRAVVSTDGQRPASSRAKNCAQILTSSGAVPARGRTMRSAYQQALAHAEEVARGWNATRAAASLDGASL